jgi:hypothetical protein
VVKLARNKQNVGQRRICLLQPERTVNRQMTEK